MTEQEIKSLRAGDVVIWMHSGEREIVESFAGGWPVTNKGAIYVGQGRYMRRETFLEYITRPTGFGRTSWTAAFLIHLFGAASVVMSWTDSPWALLGLIAPVMLWVGTYMNYKGRWK